MQRLRSLKKHKPKIQTASKNGEKHRQVIVVDEEISCVCILRYYLLSVKDLVYRYPYL